MTGNSKNLPKLTARQVDRSAGPTIAGYLYQFERSVVEVLRLRDREQLRIEGIEDIDIWAESPSVVQVKYYNGQRWSLSKVRDAVHELLKSFAAGLRIEYVLYVHFGSGDTPPDKLSLQELKECLTYRPKGRPVELLYERFDEDQLLAFTKHFRITAGVSLDDQRALTTSAIADALGCRLDEAEALHRMRAVQFMHEIAVKKSEKLRAVTRDDLIKFLNDREIFYNRWHKEAVGQERFISATVKRLKATKFNTSNTYRGVLLEVTEENLDSVCQLASELAHDMNGAAKLRTTAAKPWTLILRGRDELVLAVKKALLEKTLPFNDGFEYLHFSLEMFTEPVIVKSTGNADRLSKAAHVIRVISESSMKRVAETGYQLAQLIVLFEPEDWHLGLAKAEPTRIYEVSVDDVTEILRRVTT